MNWTLNDIGLYLAEKEYIDTVVIPLIPITFEQGIKKAVEQGEFTNLLSIHLERQFKGRILILPPFTYLVEPISISNMLKDWSEQAKKAGFQHVFFLTSDDRWKELKDVLEGKLFYVPSVPLEHMEEEYKHSIMENQLKKFMNDIIEGWQV